MIMPTKSARRRTAWRVYLVSAVMLLSIAFYLAGFEPTNALSGSKVYPLDVTADGLTLIAGSPIGESRVVGPIRFLDLADGNDRSPPLALDARDEVVTISTAKLSDDDQRLLIVESRFGLSQERFFLTVFDLPSRRVLLEKTIPFNGRGDDVDLAQFSRDGRLLAWATTQDQGLGRRPRGDTVVWDLEASKERLHLSGRDSSFQLSPDGKLLASREQAIPEDFKLFDVTTGNVAHSFKLGAGTINGYSIFKSRPTFSPDGKLVAVEAFGPLTQVFDTASGNKCFETNGGAPQFLPSGSLLVIGEARRPAQVHPRFPVPKIVVWSSDGWTKKSAFPYDLGTSLLSGTVWPHPWATGHADQFGVIYETAGGWWIGPRKSPGTASSDLTRLLGLNIPRGVGLDLVDAVTGTTRTYHLGSSQRWFPFPRAGKILTQSGDATDVWDMPPRRTYRAVAVIASVLIGIGILWLTLDFTVRRVARWYRGGQQTAEAV